MTTYDDVRAALIERHGEPTGGGAAQGEKACWWQRAGHTLNLMGYCGADDAFLILDSRFPWWLAGPLPAGETHTPLTEALDAADARLREFGVSFMAPLTFDEALAALSARYGDPKANWRVGAFRYARWSPLGFCVVLQGSEALSLDVTKGDGSGHFLAFTLAGEPGDYAPRAEIAEALDRADAWMLDHEWLGAVADARLAVLATYEPGWGDDGDGPGPNAVALDAARSALAWLRSAGIAPGRDDINADAMGGVGVYLYGPEVSARSVWLAFGNDGTNTVVSNGGDGTFPAGSRLTPESMAAAVAWLAERAR